MLGSTTVTRVSGESIGVKARLDGHDLRTIIDSATTLVERNAEAINALNVFPVPDGDTGTNMFLTLRHVGQAAESVRDTGAGKMAQTMAEGALNGARGNSGVILSQFFKGVGVGLHGLQDFGPNELARAFELAGEYAYKGVGQPIEGTLLTVMSSAAVAARREAQKGGSIVDVVQAARSAAEVAVADTPNLLPILRQAGVVDAGGHGFLIILEAARRSLAGEDLTKEVPPPPSVDGAPRLGRVSQTFLESVEGETFGYCIQLMVMGEGLDPDALGERVAEVAESTVVVGGPSAVKVHGHARDPGPLLSLAASHGALSAVEIEDIDRQHRAFARDRRDDVATLPVAVVAVAWGEGLEALFSSLGVSNVLEGGDTMNPSVEEIAEAVEAAPADNVIFLPNNANIVPAAAQAIDLARKSLDVVPSKTIPQGIAAALAFNPQKDLEANLKDMHGALEIVRSGVVTEAVRSVEIDGRAVEKGQLIGLLEGDLVAAGEDVPSVSIAMLERVGVSDEELITLYWGGPLAEEEADAAMERVAGAFPDAEVELVHGGQPHYHLIISIE